MKRLIHLSDVKNGLEKGTVSVNEASEIIKRHDNQEFIHQVLNSFDKGMIALDETTASIIANIVDIAYYIYTYSGLDTGITDTEYDKLYEILHLNGKEDFVTLPLIQNKNKDISYHSFPQLRGTLSKIHYLEQPKTKENKSRKSLDSWIDSAEKIYRQRTGENINFKDLDIYVFPKWDGVSVIFEFEEDGSLKKALTRGYTKFNTAEDVSHHFRGLKRPIRRLEGGSEDPEEYGLKTEVMVLEESVLEYNQMYGKDYKQSRAIASGIINSDKPDERNSYLIIMQLRYITKNEGIEKLCPEVFDHPFVRCKLGEYDVIENFAQDHRFTEGLRCDGCVIHIIDPKVQQVLGRENDKNAFEVAYKFTEEYEYTTVKDIEFQVGLLGRITPVVKIKPVNLKGNTIRSASLSNIDRLDELKLAKGDKVKVLYDIIPYVTIDGECEFNRSGNDPIRPKEKCPSCNSKLIRQGSFLVCNNPDCDCRKKGKILNYLVKLRIQDISYSTIDILYDLDIITSIEDIYSLHKHKKLISSIPGFGEVLFDNWLKQINERRHVPDYLVLGALGIDGVAEKNFSKILSNVNFDELMDIVNNNDIDSLTCIEGIGDKKAEKIIKGIKENKKLIKFLWEELDIYHKDLDDAKFTVCFTKVRDINLETYIINMGGEVVDSITSKTSILVVPNLDTRSSKVKLAKKHNVKIVEIDKLKSVIKRRYGK